MKPSRISTFLLFHYLLLLPIRSLSSSVIDGALFPTTEEGTYASTVDFINFSVTESAIGTIDILSWEQQDGTGNFIDVNGSGDYFFADIAIWVFREDGSLDASDLWAVNERDLSLGDDDGSISVFDPRIVTNFFPGDYILAIGVCCGADLASISDGTQKFGKVFGSLDGSTLLNGASNPEITRGDYRITFSDNLIVDSDTSLEIEELVSIQSVLNTDTADLVARKDLVVRVYASTTATEKQAATVRLCVDYLEDAGACGNGEWLEASGFAYPSGFEPTFNERLNATDSINFRIVNDRAKEWLTPGSRTFRAEIYDGAEPSGEPLATKSSVLNFRTMRRLLMQTVEVGARPLRLGIPGSPDRGLPVVTPAQNAYKRVTELIKVFFPVDDDSVVNDLRSLFDSTGAAEYRIVLIDANRDNDDPPDWTPAQKPLQRMFFDLQERYVRELQNSNAQDHVFAVALVASNSNGVPMLGGAVGMVLTNDDPDTGESIGQYPVLIAVDSFTAPNNDVWDVSTTAAHELGHLFGLGEEYCKVLNTCDELQNQPNPAPKTEDRGTSRGNFILIDQQAFDVTPVREGRNVVASKVPDPGTHIFGYMGNPPSVQRWTGNVEYEHLFRKLCKDCPEKAQQQESFSQASLESSRALATLIGFITASGQVEVESFFVIESTATVPAHVGDQYQLVFTDSQGSVLDTVGFSPVRHLKVIKPNVEVRELLEEPMFAITAALPQGTTRISIAKDGVEQYQVAKSPNPPAVEITTVDLLENGEMEISWIASDQDDDPLDFTVLFSPDGEEVQVLQSGITELSAVIMPYSSAESVLSDKAFVGVVASDGFNSSRDQLSLAYDAVTDRILLKQFNTRGPNIPGMCSRKNCVAAKTHTLVAANPSSDQDITFNLELKLVSAPGSDCKVNNVEVGGRIPIATGITLAPSETSRHSVDIEYACLTGADTNLSAEFALEASVKPYRTLDPVSENNRILKTQTVR